jgi:hypothetical protein
MDRCGDGICGYGSVYVAHLRWNKTKVSRRQLHVFGKTAVDLPPNRARKVVAHIITSPVAPPAVSTSQIVIDVYPVAGFKAADKITDLSDVARYFVADYTGQLASRSTTAVSIPDQGETETAGPDSYQHFARARLRHHYLLETEWPA